MVLFEMLTLQMPYQEVDLFEVRFFQFNKYTLLENCNLLLFYQTSHPEWKTPDFSFINRQGIDASEGFYLTMLEV